MLCLFFFCHQTEDFIYLNCKQLCSKTFAHVSRRNDVRQVYTHSANTKHLTDPFRNYLLTDILDYEQNMPQFLQSDSQLSDILRQYSLHHLLKIEDMHVMQTVTNIASSSQHCFFQTYSLVSAFSFCNHLFIPHPCIERLNPSRILLCDTNSENKCTHS